MADSLRVYNIGKLGVNVDKSPLHLDDGELTKAQNATRDARGLDGGIRKRPGLKKFNATSLAARVLGGIGLPLPLLVSTINGTTFPAEVSGADDGDAGGSGVGSGVGAGAGSGGGTGDGSGAIGSTPTGVATRTLWWGRTESTTVEGSVTALHDVGWWKSTNGFTTAATEDVATSIAGFMSTKSWGSPAAGSAFNAAALDQTNFMTGAPASSVVFDNKLYYAGNPDPTYSAYRSFDAALRQNSSPGLRVISVDSGVTDSVACVIPKDSINDVNGAPPPAVWDSGGVLSVITAEGLIFFTSGERSTMKGGRVWQLDPNGGAGAVGGAALIQMGSPFVSDNMTPYSLCWHNGRLWVGLVDRFNVAAAKIYWIQHNGNSAPLVDWTFDHTITAANNAVSGMCSFNGYLYACSSNRAGTNCTVEQRDATGAWTTSLTIATSIGIVAPIVFNSNMYCASNTSLTGMIIKKFDGTTWSTVYTGVSTSARPISVSWVENGVLYFGGGAHGTSTALVSSPDGSVWTDRSANLPNTSGFTTLAGRSILGVLVT